MAPKVYRTNEEFSILLFLLEIFHEFFCDKTDWQNQNFHCLPQSWSTGYFWELLILGRYQKNVFDESIKERPTCRKYLMLEVYRKVYDPFVGESKTEFDFSKQGGSKPFSKITIF